MKKSPLHRDFFYFVLAKIPVRFDTNIFYEKIGKIAFQTIITKKLNGNF